MDNSPPHFAMRRGGNAQRMRRRICSARSPASEQCRLRQEDEPLAVESTGKAVVEGILRRGCVLELAYRAGAGRELAHLGGVLRDIGKLVKPLALGDEMMDEFAVAGWRGVSANRVGAESTWDATMGWQARGWRVSRMLMRLWSGRWGHVVTRRRTFDRDCLCSAGPTRGCECGPGASRSGAYRALAGGL